MADGVSQQAAEDAGYSVHAIISDETKGLFGLLIEDGHDEHEARIDYGFRDSEQETIGGNASEVLACRRRDDKDAPCYGIKSAHGGVQPHGTHTQDRGTDEPSRRQTLECITSGILRNQISEVED